MRSIPRRGRCALFGALVLFAAEARADMIDAEVFSTAYAGDRFQSYAFDPATGTYHDRANYSGGAMISTYGSESALAANTPSGTVTLQGGGFYGTYFAVSGGHIYGRADNSTNEVVKWSATTGAIEARGAIPDFGGGNGADSFDWGGFTAVNWLQDSTGLYTLGHVPGGDVWSIHRMDADLNVVSTRTFTATALGYAFMIGGELFTSSSFDSNVVDRVIDFATGAVAPVDFRINNLGAAYVSNALYDPIRDRL
jgi:autoaggregation protein RapA/B/C